MLSNYRPLNLLGFLGCVAGELFVIVYLQQMRGYEPCPMCIFQRIALAGVGLAFLLAAIHGPKGRGRWVYSGLTVLAAAIGAFIAGRHVWLQSLPPDQVPACGPTLDYLLSFMPVTEVVMTILKGDGNCAKIDAQWLGLTLPAWSLIGFIGFGLLALLIPAAASKERRDA
ncbi:disulfide bond formation protein B [Solimonas soli]|uniref:disulfide bond formation protein B n=1 Tax=Solimonas soli TaxID=413479 RepID=UPI0004BB080A|nr:disulfide bond formation protein B [Solimonas soli]